HTAVSESPVLLRSIIQRSPPGPCSATPERDGGFVRISGFGGGKMLRNRVPCRSTVGPRRVLVDLLTRGRTVPVPTRGIRSTRAARRLLRRPPPGGGRGGPEQQRPEKQSDRQPVPGRVEEAFVVQRAQVRLHGRGGDDRPHHEHHQEEPAGGGDERG